MIKRSLKCNVEQTEFDIEGNILLLKIKQGAHQMVIGSVYGPNNDNMDFFTELEARVASCDCDKVVLGGDWNLTWDNSDPDHNIDIVNMAGLPSRRRSDRLIALAERFSLTDPFRILHPNKKEYTYVPTSVNMINRSRLDFFLMSEGMIGSVGSCVVPVALSSTVFDHKHILLTLGDNRRPNYSLVKDHILSDPDLDTYVKCAVCECYLQHSRLGNNFTIDQKNMYLGAVGRILTTLGNIRNLKLNWLINNELPDPEPEIQIARQNMDLDLAALPGMAVLENIDLDCEDDIFLEILIMGIKHQVLSFQQNFFKMRNAKQKYLEGRIKELKLNFEHNRIAILNSERQLSELNEAAMREDLEKLRNFDRLNNEKLTAHFVRIAKSTKCESSLEQINDENFANNEERNAFITNYYRDVYKFDDNLNRLDGNTITDFLGDIAGSNVVNNALLTDNERVFFESDLTLAELDKSIRDANMRSAPGLDGIGNKFIRKFWPFFRVPVLKYANRCFETGRLTDNFKTAKIKLIPKKGDTTKIKNWRPISLLGNFYKIISRALTARLKKYIEKLTPVGQKGYSENRQCQEILISITNKMAYCEEKKFPQHCSL